MAYKLYDIDTILKGINLIKVENIPIKGIPFNSL